ncbi:AIPR family protein [Ruegeria sp. HKCCA6707]|uniref:AIPR family protein n=1 Tax=Ruegeria sp. HKCCA6707 TaxID=2682996 RepID=UPI001487C681|nr:AIPR family protein [Ruegeria sp. HKCCA6707]
MQELQEYFEYLSAEISAEASDLGIDVEAAFLERMGSQLEAEGELVTLDRVGFQCTRAGKTLRIDGIGGDPREAESVLSVVVSDYHSDASPQKINAAEAKRRFSHLVNFITAALTGKLSNELEEGSLEAGAASIIADAWSSTTKVKLIVLTNDIYSAYTDAVLAGKIADVPVTYNIWDLTRFHRYETSGQLREKLTVNFAEEFGTPIPALAASSNEESLQSYLTVVGGEQLAEIYEKWGARLLESNVRSFLQARGAVNRGIRDTIKNEPSMFFSYNNGLSATADSVELKNTPEGLQIASAVNLQIVNGGQTTASLHAARKTSPETLKDVFVQMKLTVVPEQTSEELVPNISKYANSQNKVSAADFFSNHPFHMRMEEFSRRVLAPAAEGTNRETKWFYERARGQYLVERSKRSQAARRHFDMEYPKAQYFVKTDLAKVEMSFRMHPDMVSKGAQKNFGAFAQEIGAAWIRGERQFDRTWFRRLIAKLIVFRHLEKAVPKQDWYPGGFRANIVTYAIAKVMADVADTDLEIDFDAIWRKQGLPDEIAVIFLRAAEKAATVITNPEAGINNVTEWAKKQACWATLKRLDVDYQVDLKSFLIEPSEAEVERRDEIREVALVTGIEAQAKVVEYGGDFWKRLKQWSASKKILSEKEAGILTTCGAVPNRIPSEKQSLIAVEVLGRARSEGYLDRDEAPKIKISAMSRVH